MKKSGGRARRSGLMYPLLGSISRREKRLSARLRLLRKKIRALEAAGAEKLRVVEAAGAAKLEAAEAAGAWKLGAVEAACAAKPEAVETGKGEIEWQLAALKQQTDAAWQVAANPDLQQPFLEFLQHVAPRRVVDRPKARVGGLADGGYIMLDDFAGVRTAISGGIGDDVSWDLEIAERGIDVIQVDNTVAGPPVQHPRFDFRRLRLVGACDQPGDVTLSSLIASCPGDDQSILCKIDIEGGEWDVFAQPVSRLGRCRQIVVEFHMADFGSPQWRSRAMRCLGQITAEHQCIHVHGNNAVYPPFIVVGGVPFPSVFEATFVLRKRYVFSEETDSFPTAIDAPNIPKRAEIFLGLFPKGSN